MSDELRPSISPRDRDGEELMAPELLTYVLLSNLLLNYEVDSITRRESRQDETGSILSDDRTM